MCGATTIIFQSKNKGPVTHSACQPAGQALPLPLPLSLSLSRCPSAFFCYFVMATMPFASFFSAVILHSEQCSEAAKLFRGGRRGNALAARVANCNALSSVLRMRNVLLAVVAVTSFTPVIICALSQLLQQLCGTAQLTA